MNQINDQDDNRNDEQQMNQSAAYVPEKTEKPQNEKDYEYGPQHRFISVNFLPAYRNTEEPQQNITCSACLFYFVL